MAYRTFWAACVGAAIVAACSSDETSPFTSKPDSGTGAATSTGGGTGSGGRSSGGATGSGGTSAGGTSAGGAATGGGGTATGGGGTARGGANNDGGDASPDAPGAGGAGTGGAGTGGAGTGGAGTGGNATDSGTGDARDGGDPCGALSTCCTALSGRSRNACNTVAGSGDRASCEAVTDLFCGATDAGAGGDAGSGGCAALAACCGDTGRRANQCHRAVSRGDDALCNQVAPFFCN